DHPLLALAFDSAVADGTQAPQLAFFGTSTPCTSAPGVPGPTAVVSNLNAANIFQGSLTNPNCFPAALAPALAYQPGQQRFDFNANSIFLNQAYLQQGFPLSVQPFGFPVASNFQYAYSEQANFQIEHEFAHDWSINVAYNFNGGHHLNR